MRHFILLLSLFTLVIARDNPFNPVVSDEAFPVSTNIPTKLKNLVSETISLPNTARSVTKIIIEYKNLDGGVERKQLVLNKAIDWHMPIKITHQQHQKVTKTSKNLAHTSFIHFIQKGATLRLETSNPMVRNFMIANPHRIVIDFSRMSNFLSKKFEVHSAPFSVIRIGNHKNYYRVVIELDGKYQYRINHVKKGIEIHVR